MTEDASGNRHRGRGRPSSLSGLVAPAPRGTASGSWKGRPNVELGRIKTAGRHDAQGFILDTFPELRAERWVEIVSY